MDKRKIGSSDLHVSVVGLGGNVFGPPRLDQKASDVNIHRAQDLGINFIDTAAIYGQGQSETIIGNSLVGRRNNWVIATRRTCGCSTKPRGVTDCWRMQRPARHG